MLDSILESKINDLTEQYVCSEGKCETLAGEGYARETVNPAVRFLFSQLPSIKQFFEINYYDKSIDFFDYDYETILNKIGFIILDNFEKQPELFTQINYYDMWNFAVDSDHEYDYE